MWPFLAGFCAGMSFMTRQMTALGIFGPLVLYVLIFRYRTWSRYAPAVLGAAIPLIFLLVYNWVQVGSPLGSTYTAWDAHFALGFGDHVSPMGPFTPADGVWNAYQNLSMLSAQLFGWPYAIALAFAFLPFILGRAHRWDYLLLASFAGVVVCHMFYWAPGLMYGPRYYYEALPSLLLLTARGVFELGALPLRIWPRLRFAADAELAAFLPVLLLVALLAYNLRFYLPAQIPLYHNYNYSSDSELQTVAHAHIHHAIVFVVTNPPGFWASYGNVFFQNDPQLRGDVIFARDEGGNDSQLYPYLPGRTHYRLEGTHLTQIS